MGFTVVADTAEEDCWPAADRGESKLKSEAGVADVVGASEG